MNCKFNPLKMLFWLSWAFLSTAISAGNDNVFSYKNEHIFQLSLKNGYILHEALLAYKSKHELYLPLEELGHAIGFHITSIASQRRAEGTLYSEHETLMLDLHQCFVIVNEKTFRPHQATDYCSLGIAYDDEIYVAASLLEQWLDLKFEVQPLRARLILEASKALPIEVRLEQEARRKFLLASRQQQQRSDSQDINDARERWLGGPFADISLFRRQNFSQSQPSSVQHGITGATGFSVYGLENVLLYSLDDLGQWQKQYTLSHHRNMQNDLHPLSYRQLRAFDIYLPESKGIHSSRLRQGLFVSNRPFKQHGAFSTTTILGVSEPLWDIELYQSGVLIASQKTNSLGVYEFQDVPLFFGKNIFQIVALGPQGQKQTQSRVFGVPESRPSKGVLYYSSSLAQHDDTHEISIEADYGLSKNISWNSRLLTEEQAQASSTAWYWGNTLISHWRHMNVNLDGVYNHEGAYYLQPHLSFLLPRSAFDIRHTRFSHFESSVYPKLGSYFLEHQTELLATGRLEVLKHPFFLRLGHQNRQYESLETPQQQSQLNLFSSLLNWQLQLAIEKAHNQFSPWSFTQQFNRLAGQNRWRFKLAQRPQVINSIDLQYIRFNAKRSWNSAIGLNHEIIHQKNSLSLSSSKQFRSFALSFDFNTNLQGEASILTRLSTHLFANSSHRHVHFDSRPLNQSSLLTLHICESPHEASCVTESRPIQGVKVWLNNRSQTFYSDPQGRVYIGGLSPFNRYEVEIDYDSLAEQELRSDKNRFYFQTEALRSLQIDVPVQRVLELDGVLEIVQEYSGQIRPARNRFLRLIGLKHGRTYESRSEFDGYYLFEDLSADQYRIEVELRGGEILAQELPLVDFSSSLNESYQSLQLKITEPSEQQAR